MSNTFSEALRFILRDGQVPGAGPLPSLLHLTLGTLAVAGLGIGIALAIAVPLIFAGVRTAAVLVVATTTISALTGYSGTLGDVINNQESYRLSGVLGGAICVGALALAVEVVLAGAQRVLTPRGLRAQRLRPL